MRLTTEPMPDAVYDEAARHFGAGEWTHLIWRMASINARTRIAVTTRMTAGVSQPAGREQ